MVASKTSFVIAAVALGAATSVYAAPLQYNGGADLAARGFDEEEYLFARASADSDPSHSNTKLSGSANGHPTDRHASSSSNHSTSSFGSHAGLDGHRLNAAGSGTMSKDGEFWSHHRDQYRDKDQYYRHHHMQHHHMDGQHTDGQRNFDSQRNSDGQRNSGGQRNPAPNSRLATPGQKPTGHLAARGFDEEEYLFARASADTNPSHSNTKFSGSTNGHPTDSHASSSPTHSASSFGSHDGFNGHRVDAAMSKDDEYRNHLKDHRDKDEYFRHHHMNGKYNSASHSRFTPGDKYAGHPGSEFSHHPESGFHRKSSSGDEDHPHSKEMLIYSPSHDGHGNNAKTPVQHAKSPAQSSIKQRDFDEEDAVLLARSLGLDDDYFFEKRSFDDDMYEYY